MKLSFKKIRLSHLIVWVLNVAFIVIVGYSAALVKNLYSELTADIPYKKPLKIIRFNFTEFNKAVKNYSDSLNYIAPEKSFQDPFTNPVPKSQ